MSGWSVFNNTFINCQGGMLIGGGRRNQLKNNYCDNVDHCVHIDNRGMFWQSQDCTPPNDPLWKGLYSVNYQQPPCFLYPCTLCVRLFFVFVCIIFIIFMFIQNDYYQRFSFKNSSCL